MAGVAKGKVRQPKQKAYTLEQLRLLNDCDKTIVEKIGVLARLLEGNNIDEERTLFPTEPKFRAVVDKEETKIIKAKIFELIAQL